LIVPCAAGAEIVPYLLNRIGAAGYRMTLKGIVPFESLDRKDLIIKTDNKTCGRVVIPFRFVEKQGQP